MPQVGRRRGGAVRELEPDPGRRGHAAGGPPGGHAPARRRQHGHCHRRRDGGPRPGHRRPAIDGWVVAATSSRRTARPRGSGASGRHRPVLAQRRRRERHRDVTGNLSETADWTATAQGRRGGTIKTATGNGTDIHPDLGRPPAGHGRRRRVPVSSKRSTRGATRPARAPASSPSIPSHPTSAR